MCLPGHDCYHILLYRNKFLVPVLNVYHLEEYYVNRAYSDVFTFQFLPYLYLRLNNIFHKRGKKYDYATLRV